MSEPSVPAARGAESRSGNAGDALVAIARHHDVTAAFGLVSIHNQPLVDALVADHRYVAVRHEATTVSAADAYARVSGGLGIAVTSTGTGAGNAAGSLIESLTAGSPVLHVTGQIDSQYLGGGRGVIHETKDQRGMLTAISKDAYTVTTAEQTGPALVTAAGTALTGPRGPVSVEIPIDLQYATTRWDHAADGVVPPTRPDPDAIEKAASIIRQARRPLIWLGGGAIGASDAIEALLWSTRAGVLTSNAGRGTITENDERVVGNFAGNPEAARLVEQCDVFISIGTHFRSNETKHYQLPLPRPHVQIDLDELAIGRAYPADAGVVGDATDAVGLIVEILDPIKPDPGWLDAIRDTRRRVRDQLRTSIGSYATLCDAMRNVFDDRSPIVRDITIPASSWGNRLLPILHPTTNVNPRGGGIGQGLGMAIGAAIARPDVPTALMVGDGGLAVHLGELGTLAQEQPWVVMLVFNDRGYGVLRNLQDRHFEHRSGVDLSTPDFHKLADAFALDYASIPAADDAAAVLEKTTSRRAPVLVEVDCDTFGPMPEPFVPPVPIP